MHEKQDHWRAKKNVFAFPKLGRTMKGRISKIEADQIVLTRGERSGMLLVLLKVREFASHQKPDQKSKALLNTTVLNSICKAFQKI